jgi:hypothetical protein
MATEGSVTDEAAMSVAKNQSERRVTGSFMMLRMKSLKKELLLGIKKVVVFEVLMKFVKKFEILTIYLEFVFEGFGEETVEEAGDQIRDYML